MNLGIKQIPKNLNRSNIGKAISDYYTMLNNIPLKIESVSALQMLKDLKRKKTEFGPYPNVSLFESANRIMSDLIILHGIQNLLNGAIIEIDFDEYHVEYGHDNNNSNDILATNGETRLIGEGFNVADSFFQTKKARTLKKMRAQISEDDQLLLIYNSDAVSKKYIPKFMPNEYHLRIDLPI